jgi:hypothetical protein
MISMGAGASSSTDVSRNRPKHRAGTPRLPDMLPMVECDMTNGLNCPRHSPHAYAEHKARHRADRPA